MMTGGKRATSGPGGRHAGQCSCGQCESQNAPQQEPHRRFLTFISVHYENKYNTSEYIKAQRARQEVIRLERRRRREDDERKERIAREEQERTRLAAEERERIERSYLTACLSHVALNKSSYRSATTEGDTAQGRGSHQSQQGVQGQQPGSVQAISQIESL